MTFTELLKEIQATYPEQSRRFHVLATPTERRTMKRTKDIERLNAAATTIDFPKPTRRFDAMAEEMQSVIRDNCLAVPFNYTVKLEWDVDEQAWEITLTAGVVNDSLPGMSFTRSEQLRANATVEQMIETANNLSDKVAEDVRVVSHALASV